MSYNWENIFKEKTDQELYKIFIGQTQLDSQAKDFAQKELQNRRFNFKNTDKVEKQWLLEKLKQEDIEESKSIGYGVFNSKRYLLMTFIGFGLLIFLVVDFLLDLGLFSNKDFDFINHIFFITIGLLFSTWGLIGYKKSINRNKFRTEKIKELEMK